MRTIFWNLTDRCNLRCTHCYLREELVSPSEHPSHELSTEDCLKVVEQFEEANIFFVTVLGGEPFAKPDIMVILRRMGEKQFWTNVTTNGTLIDEEVARDLKEARMKQVTVSLEGPCAEINDSIRGKGSFKRALRGINYLRDYGIPFRIQMTVSKMNYDKIEEMAEFCQHTGAERVVFGSFRDFSSEGFSSLMNLDREETCVAAQKIAELKKEYPEFASSDLDSNLRFLAPEPSPAAEDKRFVRCGLGLTQAAVLSNGDVIPCIYMRDIVLGNLMKTHLLEIPNLSGFERFKTLRKITVDEANEQCRTCEWRYVCGGGCRGRAYIKSGDLLSPDPQMCFLVGRGEIHG